MAAMGLFKKDDNTAELIALMSQLLAVRAENADLKEKMARLHSSYDRFVDPNRLLYDGGMKELIRHGLACEFHAHAKPDVRIDAARAALIELISLLKYIPDDVIKGASAAAAVDRQLEREKSQQDMSVAMAKALPSFGTKVPVTMNSNGTGGAAATKIHHVYPGSGI